MVHWTSVRVRPIIKYSRLERNCSARNVYCTTEFIFNSGLIKLDWYLSRQDLQTHTYFCRILNLYSILNLLSMIRLLCGGSGLPVWVPRVCFVRSWCKCHPLGGGREEPATSFCRQGGAGRWGQGRVCCRHNYAEQTWHRVNKGKSTQMWAGPHQVLREVQQSDANCL